MAEPFPRLWFRRFRVAAPGAVTLVCLPHAGGVAGHFYDIAAHCAPHVQVLGVQYPGRQDRFDEPPLTDPRALARQILDAIPLGTKRPLALFGHSYGALLTYEIACGLLHRGEPPCHIFLSAHGPQREPRPDPIHILEDKAFLTEIERLGSNGAEFLRDPGFAELAMPALRADLQAAETYSIGNMTLLPVPVSAIYGTSDCRAPAEQLHRWQELAADNFHVKGIEGGHLFFMHQPKLLAHYLVGRLGAFDRQTRSLPR
jgi:surfactin synthase thioesterase subunit